MTSFPTVDLLETEDSFTTMTICNDECQEMTSVSILLDVTNVTDSKDIVQTPLLSDEAQELINFITFIVIQSFVLFPGIGLNIINMYVFFQIGLTDTVTISFFALALSDMICLFIAVQNWLCYILYRTAKISTVDMFGLMYLGVWYFQMVYDVSMLITTYTTVQKCCCVTLPFTFRHVFTRYRTTVVIVLIWIFSITCYAPVLATQSLTEKFNPKTNTSLYVPTFSSSRSEAIAANDIIIRIILQNSCQIIVIACLFILSRSLYQNTQFRHSFGSQGTHKAPSLDSFSSTNNITSLSSQTSLSTLKSSKDRLNDAHLGKTENQLRSQKESSKSSNTKSSDNSGGNISSIELPEVNSATPKSKRWNNSSRNNSNKISSKELQVVKSVTFVSTIFVLANFPRILLSIARTAEPELDTYKAQHNLALTTQMLRRVIEVTGASINFLIYYNFNKKFHDIVTSLCCCCRRQ